MRKSFTVRPLSHILHLEDAPLNATFMGAQFPSLNVRVSNNRIERVWDHSVYRTLEDGQVIQSIVIFRANDGTYSILVLTDTDLCKIETGAGETYSYLTDTYTTGTVTDVSGYVVTGSGTGWLTSGLAPGDRFILDADHSAKVEPDVEWATIDSIDSDTRIFLTANYAGTVGAMSGTYKARKVYSTPAGERWQYASVAGVFCFTNGGNYTQKWTGTGYASDLNTTYANQARYCTAYANRLVLADVYDPDVSARNPWRIRWSGEGNPDEFDVAVDPTAGYLDFVDTEEPLTGMGVVGLNIIAYKKTMYYVGDRSGQYTSALQFPNDRRGVGLYAPYSLVNFMGTNAWLGVDDFYVMNGDLATSIGASVRKKFFDLVSDDELAQVFAINSLRYNEILWVANTSSGQYIFSWNYKQNPPDGVWSMYKFSENFSGLGGFGF